MTRVAMKGFISKQPWERLTVAAAPPPSFLIVAAATAFPAKEKNETERLWGCARGFFFSRCGVGFLSQDGCVNGHGLCVNYENDTGGFLNFSYFSVPCCVGVGAWGRNSSCGPPRGFIDRRNYALI